MHETYLFFCNHKQIGMGIKEKSIDLKKRMRTALKGGGDKAIEKQKAIGKLTARERIIALLDPKSFHEYDLFVEHAAKDFDIKAPTGARGVTARVIGVVENQAPTKRDMAGTSRALNERKNERRAMPP